jgi:8-oxo-dGTP pyrophosphatase MutT (NUDIX family)
MEFDDALKALIAANLARFEARQGGGETGHGAAVAVVVTEEGPGADLPGLPAPAHGQTRAALLLTRRAQHLRRHAGQWALPGGRIDAGESPEDAALRELEEEVGLRLPFSAILGRLDDFTTRSGYTISPVVLWGGAGLAPVANPLEVDSIHRIPVSEFLREDAPMLRPGPEADRPILRMPVGNTWIAAPTAALLLQFREVCLLGRDTRVAHFDQPKFAWR